MSLAPQDFLPAIGPWIGTLDDVWPGAAVKPYFAHWEVGHLVAMLLLGGASILLNLRLIGFGLTDQTPSEVRRDVAPWLHLGVAAILITGLLIGASNPDRLYTSEAFTAKMLGLAAALILTYGVSLPLARADGRAGATTRLLGLAGILVWALSLYVFASAKLVNPGLWHVLTAAALIVLFVTRGLTRIVYGAGLAALVAIQFVATHFVIKPDDYARLDPANRTFFWIFLAWILGAVIVQLLSARRDEASGPFTKGMAYAAILVWVTTAAAGRWIAFA
jgi:hypothetical protein